MNILRQAEIVVILYAINLMVRKKMKLSEASHSLPGHASIILILCMFSGSKWRQQVAAANSEAQSIGVTAAHILWIVMRFSSPYFVPGYEKVPFFYKIADMQRS